MLLFIHLMSHLTFQNSTLYWQKPRRHVKAPERGISLQNIHIRFCLEGKIIQLLIHGLSFFHVNQQWVTLLP